MSDQQRPETGVMQFGDDWPGVFIRGDSAGYLALSLRHFLQKAEIDGSANAFEAAALHGLLSLLSSSEVHPGQEPQKLKAWAECQPFFGSQLDAAHMAETGCVRSPGEECGHSEYRYDQARLDAAIRANQDRPDEYERAHMTTVLNAAGVDKLEQALCRLVAAVDGIRQSDDVYGELWDAWKAAKELLK